MQNLLGRQAAVDPATIQGSLDCAWTDPLWLPPFRPRTAVLEPTEAGVALITHVVACAQQTHEAVLAPLSPEERSQFAPPVAKVRLNTRWMPCLLPMR